MARLVRAAGPTSTLTTFDIPEQQVLMEMEGGGEGMYHLHVLHYRLGSGRWVTSDSDGELAVDDLSELQVVPLLRKSAFPEAGRPFRIPKDYTDGEWRGLRARAKQLAIIHGWVPPAAAALPDGSAGLDGWFYADTALECFGTEVSAEALSNPAGIHEESSVGIILSDLDGKGATWKLAERVLRSDLEDWLADKRSGAGRDKRLLRRDKKEKRGQHAELLRDISKALSGTLVPDKLIFEGPSALSEILKSVEASGLEIIGWGNQYLSTCGVAPKSGLAIEFTMAVHTLHYMFCVDGLDGRHLACGEHIGRRLLQIQRAIKRNPKSPDFETLEAYMKHLEDATGQAHAPLFEQHVAEKQKIAAVAMKQDRLTREEVEAAEKRRKDKNKKDPP